MSNSWNEREKALEDGYFIQRDRELLAKMRANTSVAEHPEGFNCPKCEGKLHTGNFENVQVDICDQCGGVWLDAGEMQQVLHKEPESWFKRLFG